MTDKTRRADVVSNDLIALNAVLGRELREFHPDIRDVGRQLLPATPLYGVLFRHVYDALRRCQDAHCRPNRTVPAAAGVELFRAYCLTRELPGRDDAPTGGDTRSFLLAGDRFLSTGFDRIGCTETDAPRLVLALRTASGAVKRFCAAGSTGEPPMGRDAANGRDNDANAGWDRGSVTEAQEEDAVRAVPTGLVAPTATGVLAVDLAAVLSRGSPTAPDPLRRAGASIGVAIACRRHQTTTEGGGDSERDDTVSPAIGWSRAGSNPYPALGTARPGVDEIVTDCLDEARHELETASGVSGSPLDDFLARIGSVVNETA